jgi:hypothetical protein
VEVTKRSESSMQRAVLAAPRRCQAVTRVNVEQASKSMTWKLTRRIHGESRRCRNLESDHASLRFHRGNDDGMHRRKRQQPREAPTVKARDLQLKAREGHDSGRVG